jgi:hypothetical protein
MMLQALALSPKVMERRLVAYSLLARDAASIHRLSRLAEAYVRLWLSRLAVCAELSWISVSSGMPNTSSGWAKLLRTVERRLFCARSGCEAVSSKRTVVSGEESGP